MIESKLEPIRRKTVSKDVSSSFRECELCTRRAYISGSSLDRSFVVIHGLEAASTIAFANSRSFNPRACLNVDLPDGSGLYQSTRLMHDFGL